MTPEKLQKSLCEEIRFLMKDVLLEDINRKNTKLNVYAQNLPYRKSEDDLIPYPFCVVSLYTNSLPPEREPQKQVIKLYFGICYWNEDCQYQHTMLTMFEKIKRRFKTNPLMGEFSCNSEIISALDDEDDVSYPYYYGGMQLTFDLPNYEREDSCT